VTVVCFVKGGGLVVHICLVKEPSGSWTRKVGVCLVRGGHVGSATLTYATYHCGRVAHAESSSRWDGGGLWAGVGLGLEGDSLWGAFDPLEDEAGLFAREC